MRKSRKHHPFTQEHAKLPISFEPDETPGQQDIALPDKNPTPLSRLPHTVLMVLLLFLLFEILSMPKPFAWFTFFFIVIAATAIEQAVLARQRPDADPGPIPLPQPAARVRACGRPPSLSRLLPLETNMFEPVIVTQGTKGWTWLVALVVAGVGFYVIRKTLPVVTPNSARAPYYAYGALFALFPVVAWGLSRIRPIYYRVAPGRLDVLCFRFLSGHADLLQRIDLRDSKITVRLGRALVRFEPPNAAADEISLMNVSEPYRFAQAVLNGAISTQPTPPLPDDALLG